MKARIQERRDIQPDKFRAIFGNKTQILLFTTAKQTLT
jgi:hypothetical protein